MIYTLILRRGKLLSRRCAPLSPKGKAVFVGYADTFPKGEGGDLFRRVRDTLPEGAVTSFVGYADTFPEGEGSDLFCRVGTLFAFGFKCRSEKFF